MLNKIACLSSRVLSIRFISPHTSIFDVTSKSSIHIFTSPTTPDFPQPSCTCKMSVLFARSSCVMGNLKLWSKYGFATLRWIIVCRFRLSTSGISAAVTYGSLKPPFSLLGKLCAKEIRVFQFKFKTNFQLTWLISYLRFNLHSREKRRN